MCTFKEKWLSNPTHFTDAEAQSQTASAIPLQYTNKYTIRKEIQRQYSLSSMKYALCRINVDILLCKLQLFIAVQLLLYKLFHNYVKAIYCDIVW